MNYYKQKYNIKNELFINSYKWGEETLSLPLFPSISQIEQEYVVKILLDKIEPMVGD